MTYRDAGLSLDVIGALLQADGASAPVVLERHLQKVNEEIARLRQQQHVIAQLLGDAQAAKESFNDQGAVDCATRPHRIERRRNAEMACGIREDVTRCASGFS